MINSSRHQRPNVSFQESRFGGPCITDPTVQWVSVMGGLPKSTCPDLRPLPWKNEGEIAHGENGGAAGPALQQEQKHNRKATQEKIDPLMKY